MDISGAPVKAGEVLWMKESYVAGLASYGGPESCVHIRKDVGEALIPTTSATPTRTGV